MNSTRFPTYSIRPFSQGMRHEVKGTYFYPDTLNALFFDAGASDTQEFYVEVSIVPEPDNPYSTNGAALSVRWKDHPIGHIATETAKNYQQVRRLAASGYDATTNARIWTHKNYNDEREFWVSVELPDPNLLIPLNDPPHDGFTILPFGSAVQVTKESDHTNVLSEYVPESGVGQILVSLHLVSAGVRKTWEGIEVRLSGERIGELTKTSSEKYTPAVHHFSDLGLETICRATIKGSSLAAEVTLHGAKSFELSEDNLAPTNFSPIPRLVEYETDPSNYEVPNRWQGESQQRGSKASRGRSTFIEVEVDDTDPIAADATADFKNELSESFGKNPFSGMAVPAASRPVAENVDWAALLTPDGTPRANLFQRGYVRGTIGKHSPGNKAPRIDYATVGQCKKILEEFGEPTGEVDKRNGFALKGLWWILLALLAIVGLIGLFTPPVGWVVLALVLSPFVYHYWTRRKLKPPFGKQS